MVCIRHSKTGEVRRVSNEEAAKMVVQVLDIRVDGWRYCPKSAWKAQQQEKSNGAVSQAH